MVVQSIEAYEWQQLKDLEFKLYLYKAFREAEEYNKLYPETYTMEEFEQRLEDYANELQRRKETDLWRMHRHLPLSHIKKPTFRRKYRADCKAQNQKDQGDIWADSDSRSCRQRQDHQQVGQTEADGNGKKKEKNIC